MATGVFDIELEDEIIISHDSRVPFLNPRTREEVGHIEIELDDVSKNN